jgi:uncharacterized protein
MTRSSLVIAGMTVTPGQQVSSVVQVSLDHRSVDVPIIAINGASEGPRVAITAGIHGAEYVGIETAWRLGSTIEPSEVSGSIVIVPIANTTSFHRRAIWTSGLDSDNLYGVFPGKLDGSGTERLAHWLFQTIIAPSDYYMDLHGGDMNEDLMPFVKYSQSDDARMQDTARRMAEATGFPRLILGVTSGSTYGAASAAGIPSLLIEIGGKGVWDEETVTEDQEAVLRVLRCINVLPGEVNQHTEPRIYQDFTWTRAAGTGLFYPTVKGGDQVQAKQRIGAITDYFGGEVHELRAQHDGEVVFVVTSLAVNEGDAILGIGR